MFYCYPSIRNLVFSGEGIRFCCQSFELKNNNPRVKYTEDAYKDYERLITYRNSLVDAIKNNNVEDYNRFFMHCKKCHMLNQSDVTKIDNSKLSYIVLNIYPAPCQARCIYCFCTKNTAHNNYELCKDSQSTYFAMRIINLLNQNQYVNNKTIFQVSSGEITIHPHKGLILETLQEFKCRFLTNGFVFSEDIARILPKNLSEISISLDSGTRDTFRKVKGLDMFDKVVENIKKYSTYGAITAKYIVLPELNISDDDFNGFVNFCKDTNVKSVEISSDHSRLINQSDYYFQNKLNDVLISHNIKTSFSKNARKEE
jgi:molybdenum cofactor biosynthesis enzyme MoaA